MKITKKLLLVLLLYTAAQGLLLALGLMGNPDPAALEKALAFFSPEEISRGEASFFRGIIPATLLRLTIVWLLFAAIKADLHDRLFPRIARFTGSPFLQGLICLMVIALTLVLITLPFAAVSDYYHKLHFGLLRSGFGRWLYRHLLSSLTSYGSAALLMAVALSLIRRGRWYALTVPSLVLVFSLVGVWLYPRIITPLLYKTEPVRDVALLRDINALLAKAGTEVQRIRVINESRYSSLANAYFTGFGAAREIHLYDTLLKNHNREEILLVVAHELCHYREEHVMIGLLLSAAAASFILLLMSLAAQGLFGRSLRELARENRLPVMILLLLFFLFLGKPASNGVSRCMERRCDRYALALTGNRAAFVRLQIRLTRSNLSPILPHPAYTWFYATHPPVLKRIALAEKEH